MKIRQKLVLLVVVPLVAVLVFATLAVFTTASQALQTDRLRSMVAGNETAGDLIYALQVERSNAVMSLLAEEGEHIDDYLNESADTDEKIQDYRDVREGLRDLPSASADALERVDIGLERLDDVRDRVSKGEQAASAAAFAYRTLIADLLSFRESVPQSSGASPDVADRIRSSTTLVQLTEHVSIEHETVLRAIERGELSAAAQQEIKTANTGITESSLAFQSLAPVEWRGLLEQTQTGAEGVEAQQLEDEAARAGPGESLDIDSDAWTDGMLVRVDMLKDAQDKIDSAVADEVTELRTEQLWWTGAQVAGVGVAVMVAIAMAMRLGGPVVRGLRRLADTAHNVATEGLPQAVARLDNHEVLGNRTPEQFAAEEIDPIEIRGKDELADVGKAFNEVHQEAVRVAAAQALLRLHIGGMFVKLARRGHSLAGRLTNVLDEAERNEDDPERLERLFALDHLVTLFGRTNDSLLVLGGAAPAKVRRSNETINNVLTAAQSQIEQYTRVQIEAADDGMCLKAEVVDDVVKLLAELLDNATEYSQHQINMFARVLADRLVIQINDRGIGIKPEILESLNARLASKSALDLNSVQTMGLTVVGHIAARHNIMVELRPAPTGGTLAEVSVPADLLEEQAAPAALPAGESRQDEAPQAKRRAPLFDKANKGKNRRRKAAAGSNRQVQPSRAVPTAQAADADTGAMGLPVIRFDKGSSGQPVDESPPEVAANETAAVEPPRRQSKLFSTKKARESRVPADPGWQAALSVAAEPQAATKEDDGLPKREPMAQLVPGSIETPAGEDAPVEANAGYRNPDSVSATYVAYARARAGRRS